MNCPLLPILNPGSEDITQSSTVELDFKIFVGLSNFKIPFLALKASPPVEGDKAGNGDLSDTTISGLWVALSLTCLEQSGDVVCY